MTRNGLHLLVPLVASILIAANGIAAEEYVDHPLTYKAKTCDGQDGLSTFPFVEGGDPKVTLRINDFLHLAMLRSAAPPGFVSGPLVRDAKGMDPKDQLQLDSKGVRSSNGGRTLKVAYGIETCRANHDYGEIEVVFDVRNGLPVRGEDLLLESKSEALERMLFKKRRSMVEAEIRKLTRALERKEKVKLTSDIAASIDLYERCVDGEFSDEMLAISIANRWPPLATLNDSKMRFLKASCGGEKGGAIDLLGDLDITLTGEQLHPYLSPYGRYILLGEGNSTGSLIRPYGQVFYGTLDGRIPITLYLGRYDVKAGYSEAWYFYDKHRKIIKLQVARRGDLYELLEYESLGDPKPVLTLRRDGGRLTGHWRGNGRTYSFVAEP